MTHKPFILLKRPSKKGHIYYVKFRDDYGNLMVHRSTGQTSKAAAERWAIANRERFIKTTEILDHIQYNIRKGNLTSDEDKLKNSF